MVFLQEKETFEDLKRYQIIEDLLLRMEFKIVEVVSILHLYCTILSFEKFHLQPGGFEILQVNKILRPSKKLRTDETRFQKMF